MGCSSGPDIIQDGLVLCLDAGSKRSYPGTGTTWTDLAGNNNGTLTNGPTFNSANGGSILIDGTDEYVTLGTPPELNQVQVQLTITVWAKLYNYGGNRTLWGVYKSTDSGEIYSILRMDGTALRYYASNASASYQDQALGVTPALNVWNFYAVSVSGTLSSPTVTMYLNEYSASFSYGSLTVSLSDSVDFRIGANEAAPSNEHWDGLISAVAWYNRALSADEIRQNYLSTKERFA